MVAFETFNATLWTLVTAINKLEGQYCSIQLLRSYKRNSTFKNEFLDVSVKMTAKLSIPIILVDYAHEIRDIIDSYSVMIPNSGYTLKHQ